MLFDLFLDVLQKTLLLLGYLSFLFVTLIFILVFRASSATAVNNHTGGLGACQELCFSRFLESLGFQILLINLLFVARDTHSLRFRRLWDGLRDRYLSMVLSFGVAGLRLRGRGLGEGIGVCGVAADVNGGGDVDAHPLGTLLLPLLRRLRPLVRVESLDFANGVLERGVKCIHFLV